MNKSLEKIDIRDIKPLIPNGRKLYVETYGCQMNVNDTELVVSILKREGFEYTEEMSLADIILVNTCSIRDNAEQRIWARLREFGAQKRKKPSMIIGIIGCMAERLKEELLERAQLVDLVIGPDSYRALPELVALASDGQKGINVELKKEETYADIAPVRLDKNGVTAYVAIMRGCNNMCSYCVVPYTRGRERSRNPHTILEEVRSLFEAGYREVTLLGQNVNSYSWNETGTPDTDFPTLIAMVADISPLLRVRFATSHPKDISDKLIKTIAQTPNICRHIHLPAQSGSSAMLERMNRKYNREWYLERVAKIKSLIPDCALSTDIIAGFCDETIEEHKETISLMNEVGYEFAYMFKYSLRPDTKAAREMEDNISEDEKTRRLTEIIDLQTKLSLKSNERDLGKEFEVLVEGVSKRSQEQLFGRSSQNKVVVFPRADYKVGDYVTVRVVECSSATLIGELV